MMSEGPYFIEVNAEPPHPPRTLADYEHMASEEMGALRTFEPCHSCDDQDAGPVHRGSILLWQGRLRRAEANGGTDPESGVTADEARAHLEAIGPSGPTPALRDAQGGPAYDPVTLLRSHPDGPDPTGKLADWEAVEPSRLADGGAEAQGGQS